jgi:hypothetical protein
MIPAAPAASAVAITLVARSTSITTAFVPRTASAAPAGVSRTVNFLEFPTA